MGGVNNSPLDDMDENVCPAFKCKLLILMQAQAQSSNEGSCKKGRQQDTAISVMTVVIAVKQICGAHVSMQNQD